MRAKIPIMIILFISASLHAQVFDVDTLLYSGTRNNRVNLVILSDGYTVNELPKFVSDSKTLINSIFREAPYSNYLKYFNVFIVKVPSNQSGATHPGTAADVKEPAHQVISVDNYFGSTFDYAGICRLLVPTRTSAIATVLALNFPDFDEVLILVNSPYYGGSGGQFTVASTNSASSLIALHELGHSFVRLRDEYWAGDMYALEAANMTRQKDPLLVSWKNWYGINGTGVFQHCCGGISALWYRPHENCMMRYLGRPMCSVCMQATVESIHSMVSTLDSYTPGDVDLYGSSLVNFKINPVAPEPNTLQRKWMLNGKLLKRNIDSVMITENDLLGGTNFMQIVIEDTTNLLKVDNHSSIHLASVIWKIHNVENGIRKVNGSYTEIKIDAYPNPTTGIINIRVDGDPGNLMFELFNMNGQKVLTQRTGPLNLEKLIAGTYALRIYLNNNLVSIKEIIKK